MQSTQVLGSANARTGKLKAAALGVVLATAALGASACGASGQTPAAEAAGPAAMRVPQGMAVSCGAGGRAIVRTEVIDGAPVAAVECVPASPAQVRAAAAEVDEAVVAMPRARLASYRAEERVVTYVPRARKPQRSVRKSVLIIGSSAGVGAGVGAAVGGKKGALIGAAIGGGGATIWDQVTRRR